MLTQLEKNIAQSFQVNFEFLKRSYDATHRMVAVGALEWQCRAVARHLQEERESNACGVFERQEFLNACGCYEA